MNTFSTPDARFWRDRLRPGERLIWVGRPRVTLMIDRPTVIALGPGIVACCAMLYIELVRRPGTSLAEMLVDWQDHALPLGLIVLLAYCLVHLVRTVLILPSMQRFAITDRQLMLWRRAVSPRLVEGEIGPDLKLDRPKRPRNSVLFDHDVPYRPRPGIFQRPRAAAARRKVGFVNPADPDGMERALERALAGKGKIRP